MKIEDHECGQPNAWQEASAAHAGARGNHRLQSCSCRPPRPPQILWRVETGRRPAGVPTTQRCLDPPHRHATLLIDDAPWAATNRGTPASAPAQSSAEGLLRLCYCAVLADAVTPVGCVWANCELPLPRSTAGGRARAERDGRSVGGAARAAGRQRRCPCLRRWGEGRQLAGRAEPRVVPQGVRVRDGDVGVPGRGRRVHQRPGPLHLGFIRARPRYCFASFHHCVLRWTLLDCFGWQPGTGVRKSDA